ncbi:MAG: hypothetical protein KGN77_02075 [Xanthomonadaceae bacterium]|nr:hypothetical protein [Xanthomonadaceae bacterium]
MVNALPGPRVTRDQVNGCACATLKLRRSAPRMVPPAAPRPATAPIPPAKPQAGLEPALARRARTEHGSIPITWAEAQVLADAYGFIFNGDMAPLFDARRRRGLPRVVLDEARA